VVARCNPREKTASELAELMVGTSLKPPKSGGAAPGDVILKAQDLSMPSASAFGTPLRNISFELRRGEVLGIGGVAGNGQDELLMALSGERKLPKGSLYFDGEDIGTRPADMRRRIGVLSAPEERLGHAAAPNMSLTENAALTAARRQGMLARGFVNWGAAKGFAEKVIGAFDVRTPGPNVAARALSGGNLQKFVIGREVMQAPEVLIVNQPTWGVDAAAAAFIRQSMLDLAAKGTGVVVISQDLDELMEISDRFAALNEGRLSAEVPTGDLTMEKIGLMLGGAQTTAMEQA